MRPLPPQADAVVIGGGVVGCSIAYHLARAGLEVALVEKGFIGVGTSTATFAWVGAHRKGPAHYHRFSLQAIEHCRRISCELGVDVEFDQRGSLILLSDEEYEKAREKVPELRRDGYDIELVGRETLCEMEPLIAKAPGSMVAGATFCPADAEINPLLLLRGFLSKAGELGATFHRETAAEGILVRSGAVEGIVTNHGNIHTPIVVNAGGAATADIAQWAGLELPVGVTRGQILVTEKMPPVLNYIHSGLRQARSGNLIVGVTTDEVGSDRTSSHEGIETIARGLLAKIPALQKVRILRAYAGTRPRPLDNHPIIDKAGDLDGFYFAVMHSGITLAALVGELLSEWIVAGQKPRALERYGLRRFKDT